MARDEEACIDMGVSNAYIGEDRTELVAGQGEEI
jgi:hypothetical protein